VAVGFAVAEEKKSAHVSLSENGGGRIARSPRPDMVFTPEAGPCKRRSDRDWLKIGDPADRWPPGPPPDASRSGCAAPGFLPQFRGIGRRARMCAGRENRAPTATCWSTRRPIAYARRRHRKRISA